MFVWMFVVSCSLVSFDQLFFFFSQLRPDLWSFEASWSTSNKWQKNSFSTTNGLSFSASTHTLLFCLCLCVRLIQIDVIAHAVCVWYMSGCQIDLLVNWYGNFDELRILYLSFTRVQRGVWQTTVMSWDIILLFAVVKEGLGGQE